MKQKNLLEALRNREAMYLCEIDKNIVYNEEKKGYETEDEGWLVIKMELIFDLIKRDEVDYYKPKAKTR